MWPWTAPTIKHSAAGTEITADLKDLYMTNIGLFLARTSLKINAQSNFTHDAVSPPTFQSLKLVTMVQSM